MILSMIFKILKSNTKLTNSLAKKTFESSRKIQLSFFKVIIVIKAIYLIDPDKVSFYKLGSANQDGKIRHKISAVNKSILCKYSQRALLFTATTLRLKMVSSGPPYMALFANTLS